MKTKLLLGIILFLFLGTLSAQERGATPSNHTAIQPSNHPTNTYAVVVGISNYQDEGIPDLRFADWDAEAFASFLRSPAGGNLDDDHLKVLINENATAGQLANVLYWLVEVCQEGDHAIIYFSGHGDAETKFRNQPGFLLCWDAPPSVYLGGGTLNLNDLQEIITTLTLNNQAKVLVIADACRSGKLAGRGGSGVQITGANLATQYAKEVKILSCQPNEYSIEGEQWGGGRGAFSYHLLDGLYGLADDDADLTVSLREIRNYLEEHVSSEVAPHSQTPLIVGSLNEKLATVDPGILRKLKEGKTEHFALFKPTETKSTEENTLAQVDTAIQRMYAGFQQALQDKRFLFPEEHCAEYYYQKLIKEPALVPLYTSMLRNYAAALQDDAQQVINAKMKSEYASLFSLPWIDLEKFKYYPAYLKRAIELLGENHYMHPALQARRSFFEGLLMQLNARIKGEKDYVPVVELDRYRDACAYQPDMPLAWLEMAYIFGYKLHQRDSAHYYYHKALEQTSNWLNAYSEYINYLVRVEQDVQGAKIWVDKAMQIDSNSMVTLTIAGYMYMQAGNMQESAYYFSRLLGRVKPTDLGYADMFNALILQRKYQQARLQLERDRLTYPDHPAVFSLLGYLYLCTDEEEKADQAFEKAQTLDPGNLLLRDLKLMYYSVNEKYPELIKYWEDRSAGNPDKIDPVVYCLLLHNEQEKAGKLMEHSAPPAQENVLHLENSGLFDLLSKDYVKAEKTFKEALALNNGRKNRILFWLGHIYLQTGRREEGAAMIKECYNILTNFFFPFRRDREFVINGSFFRNAGLYDEVVQLYQIMLEANPNDPLIHMELCRTMVIAGKVDQAFTYLETALKNGYQDASTLEHNTSLANLRETERWKNLMRQYFKEQW
ncbi:MAG: hypothetical protein EP344_19955 [Bacteroidetes bacterium]|nr:MAG: hypothetical protein EP344_19955 [Bacteroidota bacterium]